MADRPDRWEALRNALEGEHLQPGPWAQRGTVHDEEPMWIAPPNGDLVCEVDPLFRGPRKAKDDADYLAAADPSTIGALLAERDALADRSNADADRFFYLLAHPEDARKVALEGLGIAEYERDDAGHMRRMLPDPDSPAASAPWAAGSLQEEQRHD